MPRYALFYTVFQANVSIGVLLSFRNRRPLPDSAAGFIGTLPFQLRINSTLQ